MERTIAARRGDADSVELPQTFTSATLFPMTGNPSNFGNTLVSEAVQALASTLPPGWSLRSAPVDPGRLDQGIDALIDVVAPDGRAGRVAVEVRRVLHPGDARAVSEPRRAAGLPLLVVAPWMSAATQAQLDAAGFNRCDLTGNVRLTLSEPGLFILRTGALHDPAPARVKGSLRGTRASAIVRRLASLRPPVGVRALAQLSGATPGYVTKLFDRLEADGAITRTATGQVAETDLRVLLERWARDAPLASRAHVSSWIDPRGLSTLVARLGKLDLRYAITGSFAALRHAPVAAPRLLSLYVDGAAAFAEAAQLRPTEAGANVLLYIPEDPDVLDEAWHQDGLRFAPLPVVVADLLSGPGRSPAEGEALLTWMLEHPEVWRG